MREFHRAPRGYELMVLINPEVTDEALTAAIDAVGGYITAPGAEITYIKNDTPWGRRRLAYPIQRFRDATYVLFQFLAAPSILTEMERELKLDERIIRYLLVRQDKLHVEEEEESPEESEAESEAGESAADSESEAGETEESESKESEGSESEAPDEAEAKDDEEEKKKDEESEETD